MAAIIKISQTTKDLIQGKEYAPDCFFDCTLDADGNWIVGFEEMVECYTEYQQLLLSEETATFKPQPLPERLLPNLNEQR